MNRGGTTTLTFEFTDRRVPCSVEVRTGVTGVTSVVVNLLPLSGIMNLTTGNDLSHRWCSVRVSFEHDLHDLSFAYLRS